MEIVDHLLSKHKVLTSFSITKRIKHDELLAIKDKLKSSCTTEDDFSEKLRKLVMVGKKPGGSQQDIPGIIVKKQPLPPPPPTPTPVPSSNKPVERKSQTSAKEPKSPITTGNKMEQDFSNLPESKKKAIIALASQMISGSLNFQLTALEIFFLIQIVFSELKINNSSMSEFNKKYHNK
jgi:hypothetical protein